MTQGLMDDCISRQAAVDYLVVNMTWYDEDGCEADEDEKRYIIEELINGVPSAQPERKRGRWIIHYECPKCGEITKDFTEYCPFCNADMRGD